MRNREVEDGFGCRGLLPTKAENEHDVLLKQNRVYREALQRIAYHISQHVVHLSGESSKHSEHCLPCIAQAALDKASRRKI